jgi:hypothetical protein
VNETDKGRTLLDAWEKYVRTDIAIRRRGRVRVMTNEKFINITFLDIVVNLTYNGSVAGSQALFVLRGQRGPALYCEKQRGPANLQLTIGYLNPMRI